jgi:hypothetical protein
VSRGVIPSIPSRSGPLPAGGGNPIRRGPNQNPFDIDRSHIIPEANFAPPGYNTLAETATRPREAQLTLAALDSPIRFGYGRVRVGALIAHAITAVTGELLLLCVHGRGPIEAVEAVEFDNKPAPAGVTRTDHLGTPDQTPDAWLVSAWAARAVTYTDALPNIAYSVLKIPPGVEFGFENIAFIVKWAKCYDPRVPATAWTDNSVLALAEFITNTAYGRGETPDWDSVAECADIADEVIGTAPGEKRRLIGLVIDKQSTVDEVEETLRGYAGVFLHREGGKVYFIPDAPASAVVAFGPGSYLAESIEVVQRGATQMPTVVTVHYTNTAVTPWADATVRLKAAGVDGGSTPWRETNLYYPGIQRHSEAHRIAVRYLNEFLLGDVVVHFNAPDLALQMRRGEVFTLTDNEGFNNKAFRLIDMEQYEPGRYRISGSEYQPEFYSDAVEEAPSIPDTGLPSPNEPPQIASVTLVEEVYQEQTIGGYLSRFKVTWPEPDFPFIEHYRVTFTDITDSGSNLIDTATVSPGVPEYRTPPVQQDRTYRVDVSAISTTAVAGEVRSASLTAQGKTLIPTWGAGAALTGFEIGGEVILSWPAAIDLDITNYEIRYGTTSQTWEQATILDRVNALTARFLGIVAGTWRFFVKARDSVRNALNPYGQETATALYVDVEVTSDASAFQIQRHTFVTPTLVNMFGWYPPGDEVQSFITTSGETWNALFTANMNTYGNPLATYGGAVTSSLETEAFDFGLAMSGAITADWDVTDLSGTSSKKIYTSPTGGAGTWTEYPGTSARASFRFIKLKVETTGRMKIRGMPTVSVELSAVEETGVVTTASQFINGSTQIAALVQLSGQYSQTVDIQGTAVNTSAGRIVVFDRILLNPESGLMVSFTENALPWELGLDYRISSLGRVLLADDYLEFDVFIDPSSPQSQDYGYLWIGGAPAAHPAYIADSATNSITGDIDIRAHIRCLDYTTTSPNTRRVIAAKNRSTGANQRAWRFTLNDTGTIELQISPDGVNAVIATSTVALTTVVSDGGDIWVRATCDVNVGGTNKEFRFYTSSDGVNWTQLGAAVNTAGTTSIFDAAFDVTIGSIDSVPSSFLTNSYIFRVQIYNGINGTLAQDFNPASAAIQLQSTLADPVNGTWNLGNSDSFIRVAKAPGGVQVVAGSSVNHIDDAEGYNSMTPAIAFDALARGQWKSRKVALGSLAGNTTTEWRVNNRVATPGNWKVLYRNIRVTNGAGVDRQTIWAGGEPTASLATASQSQTNIMVGPSNSFIAYLKDTSNTLVAGDARYSHKGV